MPSQEERLEQMLDKITGSSLDGQESLMDGSDLLAMDDMPDIESLLDMSSLQEIESMLNTSGMTNYAAPSGNAGKADLDALLDAAGMPGAVTDAGSASDVLADAEMPQNVPEISDELAKQNMKTLMEALQNDDMDEAEGADAESDTMSEEEIERLLQASREEAVQAEDAGVSEDDLMNLLAGTSQGEGDLQDIHDLLQKSDNNEAVDESVAAMAQADAAAAAESAAGPSEGAGAESGELSERQKKALEKKRAKEEKAAAKKAAKEAKKAEKLAKKSGKQAVSEEPAGEKPAGDTADLQKQPAAESGEGKAADDMSDMDSLLGMADGADVEDLIREKEIADPAASAKKGKKGLFAKILDFLTEEDEDEEETQTGTEDVPLSEENKNILDEMDKEKPGKKGKKGKKPKKGKKGQNPEDAENADGEGGEAGGGKKKKAKKPPKEKAPKETTPEDLKNRISPKRIIPVAVVCLTVLMVILLLVNLGGDFTVKQSARKAYYQEDYENCYRGLYGKTLNETEQVMFGKSESILRIRLWMREYELFISEGERVEALDVLIQAVNDYAALYDYAVKWNAGGEVSEVYSRILNILQEEYGLTEAEALAIAAEPDDVEYTKKVTAAAEGRGTAGTGGEAPTQTVNLPHMLPEEKQFPENNGGR